MDFELSDEQQALVAAVQAIMADHAELPQHERLKFAFHDQTLQELLSANGFLDAARDIGPLEAALVTYEVAKGVTAIDTIGRGLVAPMTVPEESLSGPVALVSEASLDSAIRNLAIADKLLIDCGDDVAVIDVNSAQVEPVASILAFPYGRFTKPPSLSQARRYPRRGDMMRQFWRVGLASEIAGAASAAIDFTIDYVKQRRVFGRPVGSFQVVQHRLAQRYGYAKSAFYLAMRAAWSREPTDADVAACFAQQGVQALMFDLHQFNGGMGVTTEHSLHFWLYRVRALQAEVGGVHDASLSIAERRWPEAARETEAAVRRPVAAS